MVKYVLKATGRLGLLHSVSLTSYSKLQSQSIGEIAWSQNNPIHVSFGILTGDKCAKIDSGHSTEEFAYFFKEKSTNSTVKKFGSPHFDTKRQLFNMLSSFDRVKIADAPGKQCCLDPVPAWLLQQCKTEFSPFLTELFNSSFEAAKCPLI